MSNKFSIVLCNSARARAYIQYLCKAQLYPEEILLMPDDWSVPHGLEITDNRKIGFNIYEPVTETIKKHNINVIHCKIKDINSEDTIEKIKNSTGNFIIFGGSGGQILKAPVLNQGKPILHVHPGIVPEYRGSTTIYYSILNENSAGASAFFFNEKIDEGELIVQEKFELIKGINIDYIYDPYIRAVTLVKAVKKLTTKMETFPQKSDITLPFFVIHPLLKHIAILGYS
jgi:methionyl-tRNA formyltransferase